MSDRLLKLAECERAINVSRWTLWEWIRSGKLAAIRLPGGQYRVADSEVQRILKEREPVPA